VNPYFICLSMIVSGRAERDGDTLTALDCLAHAIEREAEPEAANEWMLR
jgi:hypothetical protein